MNKEIKIYIEVKDGVVQSVHTDNNKTPIKIILCDRDDAVAEKEHREWGITDAMEACDELDNRNDLICIF